MANIRINPLDFPSVTEQDIEIVERKGIGHPDTICDSISEELSIALSKLYIKEYGAVMHHNVDKALLIGGKAEPKFLGGKVISPIEIYLTGRATDFDDKSGISLGEVAHKVAKNWINKHLPNIELDKDLIIIAKLKSGSQDLVELFKRFQAKGEMPLSNDTSFGTGFAPFSDVEKVVLYLEKTLNSPKYKKLYPYIGEDIKVMGVRNDDNIRLTIAIAFVDKYIKSLSDYKEKKENLQKLMYKEAEKITNKDIEIFINTADNYKNKSVYITVTGTAAESGDDGQVGRGNRVNGLITPYRPMSLEAAAGKNPISHVGKIYNTLAMNIAEKIIANISEVEDAYCYIVSQIGKPINEPQVVDIKLHAKTGISNIKDKAYKIAEKEIVKLPQMWKKFLNREFTIC